jgi:glycosyltransferase involved in cell wall biosynthesis
MPDVSVVMSVFNGAEALPATLDSVLRQQDCDFEFVVVNDGSADGSGALLDEWAARDSRVRVIHQSNTGLTRALVRGCGAATGEFIARQDCGDVSLPGRLARQRNYLRANADVVLIASAVRYVGPADEPLFEIARVGMDLHEGLGATDVQRIKGPPHHGATMFRKSAYVTAGGYRPAFVVAQDLDLWLRLRELGRCVGEPELGYQARLEPGSISARRRSDQFRLAELAIRSAERRQNGQDDVDLVNSFSSPASHVRNQNPRLERAKFFYFIGSCLRRTDPAASRHYFWLAFREYPLHVRGWLRLAIG